MTERPILFNGEMVRAIFDGRKTQTRRVLKCKKPIVKVYDASQLEPDIFMVDHEDIYKCHPQSLIDHSHIKCPFGQTGDRLWVRERFCRDVESGGWLYRATERSHVILDDGDGCSAERKDGSERSPWKPSIHMTREASRITLEITDVRVQRLQDISDADAKHEGYPADRDAIGGTSKIDAWLWFRSRWQSINGTESWDANPWVWVVEFKHLKEAQT